MGEPVCKKGLGVRNLQFGENRDPDFLTLSANQIKRPRRRSVHKNISTLSILEIHRLDKRIFKLVRNDGYLL